MNNPLVSVIIPTKNSSRTLGACLVSIKNQSYNNIELIVVDNNSIDTTKEIAKKYTDKVFNKGPERSAQRNFGVDNANGEYVAIIDSDMELSENVIKSCISKVELDQKIKGIIIPEESFGIGFWSQCKKLERSYYVGVVWMEAARFFDKKIFNKMGGYDEENTGTEDYDLPQRMEIKYGKNTIDRINDLIYHNEQRISLFKTCKKKFYYAQKLDNYRLKKENLKKFKKQSSLFKRYLLFFSKPLRIFKNPILWIGMMFMKTCEFGFGGMGYLIGKVRKEKMYKNIIPGLVSLDTKLTRMVGSYFIQNTGLYKDTDKKEKFHYRLFIDSNFVMPSEYDFRSEYFFKKGKCWFYEKKFLFLTFKFKYDIREKTFYFNKLFTLIPLKIGGLVPMLAYVSNFINMELFLNGFVNIRGFAFQYNKKNFCFIAPGFNGKTTFLSSMVEKGGKYISEDNLLINFLDMEVYPTSNSRMLKIYNRKTNKILEKQLNGNNIVTSKQKIDKLYLVQNTKNMNYKTSSKTLSEFLILNSLYFLTDNLFIKSFLFEENLINKFFKRLEEIKDINNYEFVQIKKYNYSSLINNLK